MTAQLKNVDMEICEGFLVHFIMTSHNLKMCVHVEDRLKFKNPQRAHLMKGKKYDKSHKIGEKEAYKDKG